MIKDNLDSNCLQFELKVLCPTKKYLESAVKCLLKDGYMDYSVEYIFNEKGDNRYILFVNSCWCYNLTKVVKALRKTEKKKW